MQNEPIPLDPLSEMLALSTRANIKNLILSGLELKGDLNRDALVLSVQRAIKKFPQLQSCLRETKSAGKNQLVRDFRPDLPLQFVMWDFSDKNITGTNLDFFLNEASEYLDRQWDLFTELPVEVHIAKMTHNLHLFMFATHHAAADGAAASEFGKEIFLNYHEAITGQRLDQSCYSLATSTSRKRKVRMRTGSWKDRVKQNLKSLTPIIGRSVLPVGTGNPEDLRQFHVKRVLPQEESQKIAAGALKGGASLLDGLVAATILSVDEWNGVRNMKPGTITTSMTVNMRGRYSGINDPNSSALLYFRFSPKDREDRKSLARAISLNRISQFRKQLDRKYYENVVRMNELTCRLPLRLRNKIIYFIAQKHQLSVAITLMGVVWPKNSDGRPSRESCLTEIGGLEVTDLHGLGYKLLSTTHVLLIVYMFNNRLNFILAASACHFTREEAESFLDLILEMLTPNQDSESKD
jgi:NRPS condensation-like uncharacterized protein